MERVKNILKSNYVFYGLLLGLCILLSCLREDYDYDLYAKLVIGESFVEHGVFNYKDILSYTPTHTWYDHEWGSGILFYIALKYLGNFGLVLLQAIIAFFTGVFITKIQSLQKHAFPKSILFMGIFFLFYFHQNPSILRCHLISYMFFTMFLYFLEKTRLQNSNILWLVPPVCVIWNNLHGGVISGLGIIFIYMVSQILAKKPWKKYFYVLCVSIPLLVINPFGMEYLVYLWNANTMTRKFITEWWSVIAQRHCLYYYPLFGFLIFGVFLMLNNLLNRKKMDLTKILILIVTVYLGTKHVKLLSLPLIVIFAFFYNDMIYVFKKKLIKVLEKLAYIVVFISVFFIPFEKPCEAKTSILKFPVKEVEFLKINNLKGNILTEFALGSYVAYKRYPENLTYFDGRYEAVYFDREFDKLMHFELAHDNWRDVYLDYPTEILMPNKFVNVYKILETDKDWVKIYEGDVCGIFVKRGTEKKNYILPPDDIEYYKQNEFVNMGAFGKNKGARNDK